MQVIAQSQSIVKCNSVRKYPIANTTISYHLGYIRYLFSYIMYTVIRAGADKYLARPGRIQATATKLGIYSTYSPRSSLHFLARYSNFCKPLKKKLRNLSVQPCLRFSNDLRVGRKLANFQLFSSVQGTGGSPTGPDPQNRLGDQDTGSPGRLVSSGLQVPGEPGHCRATTRPLWWPSLRVGVFPSKCPSFAPAEIGNIPRR